MKLMNEAQVVNTLAQCRATVAGIMAVQKQCSDFLIKRGGGKSRRYLAVLRHDQERVSKHAARDRIEIRRRKAD